MSEAFTAGVAAQAVGMDAIGRIMAARGFAAASPAPSPAASGPRHFAPAAPGSNPTEGWDMFEAAAEPVAPVAPANPIAEAVDAARAEGYALGLAAGEQAARAQVEATEDALAAIAQQLAALRPFDPAALAERLRATVMTLVRATVGDAAVDADRLAARIKAAADMLVEGSGAAILRLNPEDAALVEGRVPEPMFAIADPNLPRAALVVESRDVRIEDGPEQWMNQLAAALERTALPC